VLLSCGLPFTALMMEEVIMPAEVLSPDRFFPRME
jgi:hypothetical protein